MGLLRTFKTSFTAGEVWSRILGRGDLRAYENGAARLRNVLIHPTGGVTRRPGLRFLDAIPGKGRLAPFEFNTEQGYVLAFSDQRIDVFMDDLLIADFATPWTEAQLAQINWTQSADTLLVVHPDVPPKKITRLSHTQWQVEGWSFIEENSSIKQPYRKFAADEVTLQPSATTGNITLTASADTFLTGHAGTRFRLGAKEVEITAVNSATSANATVKQTLGGTAATKDWEEQAFSPERGWPVSVVFHQDRLVIGGSRDQPNRLWMSKSSDLFNFDLGEGLDDEAIEFAILSDQVNAVRAVFSGRHLQVFTSGAEWMVTGDPLTPGNMQLHRQTRVGSPMDRTVPPCDVDGATMFVARSGKEVREFLFTDVEQAYQSNDLGLLAQHLVVDPVEQDYDSHKRLLYVVMGDGRLGTVTVFRAEQVTAWSLHRTDGDFLSVTVLEGKVYVLVQRENGFFVETFDETFFSDSAVTGTSETPASVWSGLDHLNGQTVKVVADGALREDALVEDGQVTLSRDALVVRIGLAFNHEIEPLPPGLIKGQAAQGGMVRLVSATYRLKDTAAFSLDLGTGALEQPFKKFGLAGVLDEPPPLFTGDKTVRALGWKRSGIDPLWRIEQDTPFPFTLLSVSQVVKAGM